MIYELDPLGDGADSSLCVLHDPPRDMGSAGVRPSRGRPVGDDAPPELRIEMSDLSPGTGLGSLVGNTVGYLIADEALAKALTVGIAEDAIEVLPVTIINHLGRTASTAYRVVNPLGSHDAVDLLGSDVLWADGEVGGQALRIREPVVDASKVEGVPGVFRLEGLPGRYFLTAATARSLQGHGFTNVLTSEIQTVSA